MNSLSFVNRLRQLEHHYPSNRKLGLDNMLILLDRLGHPHRKLPPIIHIAGTNGKGSTQAILKSILSQAGYRVHAYTSPHLVNFTERIILNNQHISEQQFLHYLDHTLKVLADAPISWFELTTAIAFQAFANTPSDVVLLETGLGGRLDATNVIDQPACVIITSISFDHQNVLGYTLAEIAGEKAGIIKADVPVVLCQQSPDVHRVIAAKSQSLCSPLYYQTAAWDYKIDTSSSHPLRYCFAGHNQHYVAPALIGRHQFQNASMALTALRILQPSLPLESTAIDAGLSGVMWPGRLQNLQNHPWQQLLPAMTQFYLDGAHNVAGIKSIIDFINDRFKNVHLKPTIILGALQRKDLLELLSPLQKHVQQIIAVPIDNEAAHAPKDIVAAAQTLGIPAMAALSIVAALKIVRAQQLCPQIVIICGSLYLAGQVLAAGADQI